MLKILQNSISTLQPLAANETSRTIEAPKGIGITLSVLASQRQGERSLCQRICDAFSRCWRAILDCINRLLGRTSTSINTPARTENTPARAEQTSTNTTARAERTSTTPDVVAPSSEFLPSHMLCACETGNLAIVNAFIQAGATLNEIKRLENPDAGVSDQFISPLAIACRNHHVDVVRALINAGALANEREDILSETLFFLCENGHNDLLALFTNARANLNITTQYRNSLLHIAVGRGDLEAVGLLIDAGAPSDIQNLEANRDTPLHIACRLGHEAIALRLIQAGAPVGISNLFRSLPLHLACRGGHEAIVQALIQARSPLNELEYLGQYIRMEGLRPIDIASIHGHAGIVNALIAAGAGFNTSPNNFLARKHPIHHASERGHIQIVEALLNAGENVNVSDQHHHTPLILAITHQNPDLVRLLIARNAYPGTSNPHLQSPLEVACRNNNLEIAQILINTRAYDNPSLYNDTINRCLTVAYQHGNEALLEALLQIPNQQSLRGFTVFQNAIRHDRPNHNIIRMLVNANRSLLELGFFNGNTLLCHAARENNPGHIVELFIELGANVNARNQRGETALHSAVVPMNNEDSMQCRETILALRRAGADVNARNRDHQTPLDIAQQNGNQAAIEALTQEL